MVSMHVQPRGWVSSPTNGWELPHHELLHPPSADLSDILTPLVAEPIVSGQPVLAVLPAVTVATIHRRLYTMTGLHTNDAAKLYRHRSGYQATGWTAATFQRSMQRLRFVDGTHLYDQIWLWTDPTTFKCT